MKLYVAGPMSGFEHYNFPAFHEAADALRSWGHTVLNPADKETKANTNIPDSQIIAPGLSTATHREVFAPIVRRDIEDVLSVEGVVFLHGWERSLGARLEYQVAHALNLLLFEMWYTPQGEPSTIQPIEGTHVLSYTTEEG